MKGGTRNRVITRPFTSPGSRDRTSAPAAPSAMTAPAGSPAAARSCMSFAAVTEASPATKPMERSIPPVMMTSVSAAARRSGSVWRWTTCWKFPIERKFLPVKLKVTSKRSRNHADQLRASARPARDSRNPPPRDPGASSAAVVAPSFTCR